MSSNPSVIVVGGGSTGCGIVRDLALRGVEAVLVERGTLTHGTTGRMHGLLHSGGRYAVSDRDSARECIVENRVLREIASHCVEETGGLFVARPEDDAAYFEEKLEGCRACDIPAEVLSGAEAREREPYLARDIERAIAVPDAAIDPFRLCVANAADAEEHGARVLTHTDVTDVLVEDGRVVGVEVEYGSGPGRRAGGTPGETDEIRADHVINATGAWAGAVAAMAGVDVEVRPSKGAMTVLNVRQVDTVINRCRPKGDADIVVPHETACILGTTDEEVDDPDDYDEEGWEVELLIEELSELVPILAEARTLRSFWGVRPLYEPPGAGTEDSTAITRDYFVLEHDERDGLEGLSTVVGGKLTTYRLMAEDVVDRVCDRLGVDADCETATRPLPGSEEFSVLRNYMEEFGLRSPIGRRSVERLGSRADEVLGDAEPNPVVCECEAVTRAELQDAIADAGPDLNAVRIRTRASMGNCQGGFCVHRMAAELYPDHDAATVADALEELYDERWKGQRHALWGEQLSQAMLNHVLHATTMNRDRDRARTDDDSGACAPGIDSRARGAKIDFEAFDRGIDSEAIDGGQRSEAGGDDDGDSE